jgi:hypothetical protein
VAVSLKSRESVASEEVRVSVAGQKDTSAVPIDAGRTVTD